MPTWSEKSELEKAVSVGLHGAPEVRPEERSHLLGELRERVLAVLTADAIKRPSLDPAVVKAMQDPRASAVVLDADLPYDDLAKYLRLAKAHDLPYTMRSDPAHRGDIGLVVVSDRATS